MAEERFSKRQSIQFGWDTMKNHFWFFINVFLIVIAVQMVPILLGEIDGPAAYLVLPVNLLVMIVGLVLQMGVIKICLKFCSGIPGELSDLLSCFPLFFRFLIGQFLYNLLIMLGFFLLVVPGIYWAIKYQLFSYLIVEEGMGPVEAMEKSGQITRGAKWDLFVFAILLGLINLAGLLCLYIGLLVTIPVSMIAMAHMYKTLRWRYESEQLPPAEEPLS